MDAESCPQMTLLLIIGMVPQVSGLDSRRQHSRPTKGAAKDFTGQQQLREDPV